LIHAFARGVNTFGVYGTPSHAFSIAGIAAGHSTRRRRSGGPVVMK